MALKNHGWELISVGVGRYAGVNTWQFNHGDTTPPPRIQKDANLKPLDTLDQHTEWVKKEDHSIKN